jgi:hypothetical protein
MGTARNPALDRADVLDVAPHLVEREQRHALAARPRAEAGVIAEDPRDALVGLEHRERTVVLVERFAAVELPSVPTLSTQGRIRLQPHDRGADDECGDGTRNRHREHRRRPAARATTELGLAGERTTYTQHAGQRTVEA